MTRLPFPLSPLTLCDSCTIQSETMFLQHLPLSSRVKCESRNNADYTISPESQSDCIKVPDLGLLLPR